MTGIIGRRSGLLAICALTAWLTAFPAFAQSPSTADTAPPPSLRSVQDEGVRAILEKSLSIVEIDKQIAHIDEQQRSAAAALAKTRSGIAAQEQAVARQREQAGRVIRAYYAGERDFLLSALVSADSLSGFLSLLDYFDMIFSNDRRTLDSYMKQYKSLKSAASQLDKQTVELAGLRQRLQTQRQRVLSLQRDVDGSIDGRSDAVRLRAMIQEMTDYWQNIGMYEVQRYFKALSKAMNKLPDWVQDNKDMLEIDGLTYTLTIPEEKLNAFLREQNPLFDNFSFRFGSGKVTVEGQRDGLDVRLLGHYTLEDSGSILFHIDELLFNGLALPDTTRAELEKQFDLGLTPQKIVPFLKAKSVKVEDGKLIVALSVSF